MKAIARALFLGHQGSRKELFWVDIFIVNKILVALFVIHAHGIIILFAVIVIARGKTTVVEV